MLPTQVTLPQQGCNNKGKGCVTESNLVTCAMAVKQAHPTCTVFGLQVCVCV